VPIATRKPPMTRRPDDIQTIQGSPREGMIGALSAGLVAAVAAGDLEAARVANEAIGRLLGPSSAPPATTAVGEVVDLASARHAGR
jgi:ABC-type nitrate/sulfonate/bicarbonate transport system substrate-binding protein